MGVEIRICFYLNINFTFNFFVNPASYLMGTRGSFPGGKAAGE